MKVKFQPFGSSYVMDNKAINKIGDERTTTQKIDLGAKEDFARPDKISFCFEGENPGTIFNTFENITLNSFWDIREDQEFCTFILGRNHMFYTADGVPIAYTNEYGKQENNLNIKISGNSSNPLNFLNMVNYHLVNTLKKEELYDDATYISYKFDEDNFKTNNLDKSLNRDNVRRISENHFVISGYNLLFQEIKVDNNVINSVVPSGDFSWFSFAVKNTILSLFDVTKNQNKKSNSEYLNNLIVSHKVEIPKFLFDGFGEIDSVTLPLINEYLSNYLLKQVEYCYSGKIFMKYNPRIEIGDTITLLDEISSTYGVFRVDSFEHSFDTRGLITVVNVKATWDFKDPLLDTFSYKIGNDLLNDLGLLIERIPTVDGNDSSKLIFPPKNKTIQNIMESYLKYLVQSPKYTMLFHITSGIIFDELKINHNNSLTPTPLPLRFMPMFVRGKIQMPENLKCVFFNAPAHNYTSFLSAFYISFMTGLNKAWNSICNVIEKGITLTVDFILSIYTVGLHELFKPLLGITKRKAIESTFSQNVSVVDGEIQSMQSYNPYTGVQNASKEFSMCFFNIQMRKDEDMAKSEELIKKSIELKEKFVNSLIEKRNFNGVLLVELYDTFIHNEYNYKTFLSKFNTTYSVVRNGKTITYGSESPLLLNKTEFGDSSMTEYGATIFNQNKNQRYNITSQTKSIPGMDRNIVETIVEFHSHLYDKEKLFYTNPTYDGTAPFGDSSSMDDRREKMYGEYSDRPYKYKIIWFHNLYGSKDINNIEIRKKNVELVLNYYTEEYNSKMKYNNLSKQYEGQDYGYIIMADCNLQVVNHGADPIFTVNGGTNYEYHMSKDHPFTQLIKQATTFIKDKGLPESNLFDNVLVSNNAKRFVRAHRLDYTDEIENRLLISDHLPVYIKIDFTNQK